MKLDEVKHTFVGGVKTACVTRKELVEIIAHRVNQIKDSKSLKEFGGPLTVFASNGQGLSLAHTNNDYYDALKCADIIHADGQSIVSFSKWFGDDVIPERSATTDTIHDIPNFYSGTIKHFLLGGTQDVVDKCATLMQAKYNNFEAVGSHHGYFDTEQPEDIIAKINAAAPDVLWIGLGKPKEQKFVIKHKSKINVPIIISCGGCYNYVTGDYARAPQWVQNLGLEWMHRAFTEPRKLLWRYITTNPHAIYCAVKYRNSRY